MNFKFGKVVNTNKEEKQWINLGDLSEACLTDPETCNQGVTVAAWIKIKECTNRGGIISGNAANRQGFKIHCARVNGEMYIR